MHRKLVKDLVSKKSLSKNYHADSAGTAVNFRTVGAMFSRLSSTVFSEDDMEADLSDIDEDFAKR